MPPLLVITNTLNKIKYMADKKDKSIIIFISKCALLIFLDCLESPRREGLYSS